MVSLQTKPFKSNEMLVFDEKGRPAILGEGGKIFQSWTKLHPHMALSMKLNPGHIRGKQGFSKLPWPRLPPHPLRCFLKVKKFVSLLYFSLRPSYGRCRTICKFLFSMISIIINWLSQILRTFGIATANVTHGKKFLAFCLVTIYWTQKHGVIREQRTKSTCANGLSCSGSRCVLFLMFSTFLRS